MKISYNWLKDYLNIDLPAAQVAAHLTELGLEVGKTEFYQSVKGGLEGLVIGHVLTCKKHENSDHLNVTTVDVGSGTILPIVCGAANVAAGQKVIVATVGTVLYDSDEPWEIKKAKIRGEVSEGMICAEDEIGLGHSHEGIMVLPDTAVVGTKAKDFFDVYEDYVFEVDITPNRQDAFSHFGVARDLWAFLTLHSNLKLELNLPKVDDFKQDDDILNIDIEILNNEACPRYSGVTLTGLQIQQSPVWMQNRLKAIGLKPINNLVDVTNYVLLEIGHPLHAFDADKIAGNKIVVTTVKQDTKFVALDERELKLTTEDLMICDANHTPMCMGGVMGGLESAINAGTSKVFIESAFFNPVWIRKSAKRHQMSSDSSYRFERGVDPNNGIWALKRAALLMKEMGGGKVSSSIKDVYPHPINNFKVELTFKQLRKIAGFDIDLVMLEKILELLEIKILNTTNELLLVEVPTYRYEVRSECDVIEDVLRIYGYNNLPMSEFFAPVSFVQEQNKTEVNRIKVSDFLTSNGFYETMSFSLVDGEIYDKLEGFDKNASITLQNPLSKKLDTMRQSLIFGALDAVARNINFQNSSLKLFEFGSVYHNTNAQIFEHKYVQKYILSLTVTGLKNQPNWITTAKESDFYTLKSYAESVLKLLNVNKGSLKISETDDAPFKYGLEYKINGKILLKIGAVNRKTLKYFDIEQDVFFAEIDWHMLNEISDTTKFFTEMVKFQKVKRDLSMFIDSNVKYSEIEQIALQSDKLIKEVNIFDVYEGKNIPTGKKSYAISFYLLDETKTLTDEEIEQVVNKLIKNYKEKVGAEIRM